MFREFTCLNLGTTISRSLDIAYDFKEYGESLMDATTMIKMAISKLEYAQDYHDYLTHEQALIDIDKQNNDDNMGEKQHDVSHVSTSNSILDIRTLDHKEEGPRLLGRVETTIWIQVQMKKKD